MYFFTLRVPSNFQFDVMRVCSFSSSRFPHVHRRHATSATCIKISGQD